MKDTHNNQSVNRKNPQRLYKKVKQATPTQGRVPQVVAHERRGECGLEEDEDLYDHEPNCYYQARSRQKPSKNLQHITPCFKPEIVETVANISLEKGANYESELSFIHLQLTLIFRRPER